MNTLKMDPVRFFAPIIKALMFQQDRITLILAGIMFAGMGFALPFVFRLLIFIAPALSALLYAWAGLHLSVAIVKTFRRVH